MEQLRRDIKKILENDLPHIRSDIKELMVNQKWLMKFFWILAGVSISTLIATLFK